MWLAGVLIHPRTTAFFSASRLLGKNVPKINENYWRASIFDCSGPNHYLCRVLPPDFFFSFHSRQNALVRLLIESYTSSYTSSLYKRRYFNTLKRVPRRDYPATGIRHHLAFITMHQCFTGHISLSLTEHYSEWSSKYNNDIQGYSFCGIKNNANKMHLK